MWTVTLLKDPQHPDPQRRVAMWFHHDRDSALDRAMALSRLHGNASIKVEPRGFEVDARSYFSDGGPWRA